MWTGLYDADVADFIYNPKYDRLPELKKMLQEFLIEHGRLPTAKEDFER
jgi:hypothetical protein